MIECSRFLRGADWSLMRGFYKLALRNLMDNSQCVAPLLASLLSLDYFELASLFI